MNMTRKPATSVHTKLIATRFCPTWFAMSAIVTPASGSHGLHCLDPLAAVGRPRPKRRRGPLPLRAGAPTCCRLLDAAEAREGQDQEREAHERHRPSEGHQARRTQREAENEREQIPS